MGRLLLFLVFLFSCAVTYGQQVALTFDDAPTPDDVILKGQDRTRMLLEALRSRKVEQVAFFVITSNLDEPGTKRIRAYTDDGHLIANHSHQHRSIAELGYRQYIKDIQIADSVLSGMQGFAPWYRYPFLDEGRTRSDRDSIRKAVTDLSLANGYVTVDNYDWYLNSLYRKAVEQGKKVNLEKLKRIYIEHIWNSIQFYDNVARVQIMRSPKHVLLLHENDLAAMFAGDLIDHLRRKGWQIISPRAAYQDEIATIIPDVLFNGQGRVAAIAYANGVKARDLVQLSEDEAWLDALVERERIFE